MNARFNTVLLKLTILSNVEDLYVVYVLKMFISNNLLIVSEARNAQVIFLKKPTNENTRFSKA